MSYERKATIPWIEKYRPNNFGGMELDDGILKQINVFMNTINDSHLILTGPPGVGKTSTVKCIAKSFFKDEIRENFLEINSGEDRGIKNISDLIPKFCSRINKTGFQKIILFDEADNLPAKSQNDINNMIKTGNLGAKFIFTCNDSSKIIEDIQSICRIIYFGKLTIDQMKEILIKISDMENLEYDNDGIDTICKISIGDMRKAINNLQLTAYSFGKISKKNVIKICNVPDPEISKKIIELCFSLDFVGAIEIIDKMIDDGFYCVDIINELINEIKYYKIKEHLILKILHQLNCTKVRVSMGLKSKVQLSGMICNIVQTIELNN